MVVSSHFLQSVPLKTEPETKLIHKNIILLQYFSFLIIKRMSRTYIIPTNIKQCQQTGVKCFKRNIST